jgi:hypothetical protein
MFANIKRKKLKVKKRDYHKTADAPLDYDIVYLTKDELRFMALARPDLVVIVPRYTLICELIEPANAEHKQRTKYLASIAEDDLTSELTNVVWRERFWEIIDIKLSPLKLAPDVEQTARAKINKTVPRPTENELKVEMIELEMGINYKIIRK